jgi:hypothetical protein
VADGKWKNETLGDASAWCEADKKKENMGWENEK